MTRPDAQQHLKRLAGLWRQEGETSRARFAALRRDAALRDRIVAGVALRDLQLDDLTGTAGGRLQLWLASGDAGAVEACRVRVGDPVVLWWQAPDEPDALRAVVTRRQGSRLAVQLDGELPERFEQPGFRLDLDDPQATFRRGARAIDRFRDADARDDTGRLRAVLFADRAPRFDGPAPGPLRDAALNAPQARAVAHACAAEDVALIHGPPGTGKTRTLVEVIHQAVARGERVLATAASNAAVDNLAERCIEAGLRVARLGHPARVAPAVSARALDALLADEPTWRLAQGWLGEANARRRKLDARGGRQRVGWRERREALAEVWSLLRDAREALRNIQDALLDRVDVVCATAAGADARLLGRRRFDLVVLDEATQAPDPIALVPLSRAHRVVMAGDPRQLPPTILDEDAARAGLAMTLFERLAARDVDALRMLTVQHRMHAEIMRFPSRSMYDDRLIASPAVAAHTLADLGVAPDPLRPHPLILIDTAGKGFEETRSVDDPSTANPAQAARTAAEARRLLGRGLAPDDLAVITPYDAQARVLRALLADLAIRGLEIGTIDGFQGREKEAVIVDLVRSNPRAELGFLTDTRRMNVALTRARRFLLVVADSATLGQHPYHAAFLDTVEACGGWISAWSDDAPPFDEAA